jgi:hypothetical protein
MDTSVIGLIVNVVVVLLTAVGTIWKLKNDSDRRAASQTLEMTKQNHTIELSFTTKLAEAKGEVATKLAVMEERLNSGKGRFERVEDDLLVLKTQRHDDNNSIQKILTDLQLKLERVLKRTARTTPDNES